MRVLYFGSGGFGVPTLAWLLSSGHEVAAVVTQPAKPAGRGRRATPTPIAELASQRGLTLHAVEDVNEASLVDRLLGAGARLGVVAAFGQKLGRRLLDGLPSGCINLHASLLPRYRGAAPIQRAIINGERATGVTVFRMTDRMDAGPMLSRRETAITDDDTYETLHERLAALGPQALAEAMEQFANGGDPVGEVQDESAATRAPRLRKEDGRLDFSAAAQELSCRIRGTWPWPGASCRFVSADGSRDEAVTIASAVVVAEAHGPVAPGTLTDRLAVATGSGALKIVAIKPASGRLMSWQDFVNGRHVRPGDRFG